MDTEKKSIWFTLVQAHGDRIAFGWDSAHEGFFHRHFGVTLCTDQGVLLARIRGRIRRVRMTTRLVGWLLYPFNVDDGSTPDSPRDLGRGAHVERMNFELLRCVQNRSKGRMRKTARRG